MINGLLTMSAAITLPIYLRLLILGLSKMLYYASSHTIDIRVWVDEGQNIYFIVAYFITLCSTPALHEAIEDANGEEKILGCSLYVAFAFLSYII